MRDSLARKPAAVGRALDSVVFKTGRQSEDNPNEYIMSTDAVDRMGDIIEQGGWSLKEFRQNPIALFGHNHDQPIGRWENVRVVEGKLRGILKLADPGTSPLIDTLHKLIQQRILKAVSVGFYPTDAEPITDKEGKPSGGYRFLKNTLVECSLVSVPANQEALSVVRAMDLSPEVRQRLFAKSGTDDAQASTPAKPGDSTSHRRRKTTMDNDNEDAGEALSLAQQIRAKEKALLKAETALEEIEADVLEADGEMTDEQETAIDKATAAVETLTKQIERLQKLEQAKGRQAAREAAADVSPAPGVSRSAALAPTRLIRGPAREEAKADLSTQVTEWIAANVIATIKAVPFEMAAEKMFGKDHRVHEFNERAQVAGIVQRATAEVPANTFTPAWAGSLTGGSSVGALLEALAPNSVLPKILARPSTGSVTFGPGANSVTIPIEGDAAVPLPSGTGLAGNFFGEADPIRVAKGVLEEMTLSPKETGVIVPWTRRLERMSTVDVLAFIERIIRRHTARRLDAVLLSATAATTVTPRGLGDTTAGGATSTVWAIGGAAATIGEIEAQFGALIDALGTEAIDPVLLIHEDMAKRLGRIRTATGPKAFMEELAGGSFMSTPVLTFNTAAPTAAFSLDCGRFVAAMGNPAFDISSEATLHMEQLPHSAGATGVQPLVAAGTTAEPQRSLFQTASRAVRMILDASWDVGGTARSHALTGISGV